MAVTSEAPDELLRIFLFGDFRLLRDSQPVAALSGKILELLAFLLLNHEEVITRETIAASLWPDTDDSSSRANLRRHLSVLQQILPSGPWIAAERNTLRWIDEDHVRVDAWEFIGRSKLVSDAPDALALYRNDLLPRVDAEWLVPIREEYRAKALGLASAAYREGVSRGDVAAAIRFSQWVLNVDPLREDVLRSTMWLKFQSGDRAGALSEYRAFAQRIATELDAEPMPETVALYEQVRSGRLHETEPRPASRGAGPADVARSQPLVGRRRETMEVREALAEARAVTIVGIGGIGKSRLASAVAGTLANDFPDGVYVVELAESSESDDPVSVLGRALGLAEMPTPAISRVVADHLRDRRALIVIDDCERHVDKCGLMLALLTTECAGVRVLATSRVPIQYENEHIYRLGPLSVPTVTGSNRAASDERLESDAVELFTARALSAGATGPANEAELSATEELCRRLDGIPLALELAAARRRLLTVEEILDRLGNPSMVLQYARDSAPQRQRTVRGTIAWSVEALGQDEARALRALSVFRAPFSMDDVEAALVDSASAVDAVTRLVDSSLVTVRPVAGGNQFRLLEPIREFANEQLVAAGEARRVFEKVATACSRWMSTLGLPEGGEEQSRAFDVLENKRANVRATLEGWAASGGLTEVAVDVACAMATFWQERGYVSDGYGCFETLLTNGRELSDAAQRRLGIGVSTFARLRGDYRHAQDAAECVLQSAERDGDRAATADAVHSVALVEYTLGKLDMALRAQLEVRRLASLLHDESRIGRALSNLGLIATQDRAYDEATNYLLEAVLHLEKAGQRRLLASAMSALAYAERFRGNVTEARQFSERALIEARRAGNRSVLSTSLSNLAHVAVLEGQYRDATTYLHEGLQLAIGGGFLFALVHDLEVCARLFFKTGHDVFGLDCLYAAGALAQRHSLLRTPQEARALADLRTAAEARVGGAETLKARLRTADLGIDATIRYANRLLDDARIA